MIAGWLLYCVIVSALLAIAASAGESLLTARGRPARWVWIVAILATVLIPATTLVVRERERARPVSVGGFSLQTEPAPPLSKPGSVTRIISDLHRPRAPELSHAETLAVAGALLCIAFAALRVVVDSLLLFRSRRRWTPETVDGVPVLVSDDLGPAIVGLIEPRIVLPRWTLALDHNERSLMLEHEQEHLRTGDGRLTTAALLAVVCMPWSPALWWSFRRLRTAIEVDCDRRVLRVFPDVRRYGRLLVEVANRAMGSSMAVAGFSERATPLARRIQAMTAPRVRSRIRDLGAVAITMLALAGSLALLPPEAPARFVRTAAPSPESAVAKYVGDSISDGDSIRIVAAATDLPPAFTVAEYGMADGGARGLPGCPARLRDERDGTRLQKSMAHTSVGDAVQRGDTVWLQTTSMAFYHVRPAGRYGVGDDQTLRVGCGSSAQITVGGRPINLTVLSSLDGTGDDRAFRIAERIARTVHVQPTAVELFSGRLNVGFPDRGQIGLRDDKTDLLRRVFSESRDVLGRSAMPETLAVTLRVNRMQWRTLYYYGSMEK